ncbi:M48 family metallopeptidase [Plastoroseomonas arctica]|uniref:M48 family metallopeptidase n=1 Tax=Plastoroseomonas arctica TaxID=1509237 RepID=A0AAF1JX31_9PROT|nr:SprT family zinc-dependent metalloprotease [Plastoroseomonas arctica]MBR0655292.1 M48 family metallopeptidase [Plastoroseomonas arctica]
MEIPSPETVALRIPAYTQPLPCTVVWKRSARARRVSLRIDPSEGAVVITLPPRAGRRAGMALLTEHAAWVMQRIRALAPSRAFAPGSEIPVGNIPHVIRHDPAARGSRIEGGAIIVGGAPEFLARRVTDALRAEAKRRISPLIVKHATALAVRVPAIRLKDTKSRWGSCAPDGTIAFSWRLVMAPDWVLDYVVAHEVAHRRELNHSHRFWAHVETLTSHREAAVTWLRDHGAALLRIG